MTSSCDELLQRGVEPVIVVENLRVVRGKRPAIHDLSVQIARGSITGLLGPSGCGKTTLMRSIVGTQIITAGSVTVLGHPAGSAPLRKRVGYMPQDATIYDDLRVVDNVRYFGSLYGMDSGSADLKTDNVEGKNPFGDKRVRQAMNMTLNRQAIQRVAMRGQSVPTGAMAAPFVHGWTKELDAMPVGDANTAKKLLADAGYPNGFNITLHCPNDRYVNDEAICQAAVGMWGQIGVKLIIDQVDNVTRTARYRARYFQCRTAAWTNDISDPS